MLILKPLRLAYLELIHNRRRQLPFWMLAGFLPTFAAARWTVHTFPDLFLDVRGVHVHHFTYGFFVLAILGFVALTVPHYRRLQAFVYGVGLALCFDEFGMWVKLTDNYNIEASEDAMVIILSILVFIVYGIGILRRAYIIARNRFDNDPST
ncbi:hypothetical protein IPG36_07655 [bacterium]|nr:MAG: hypothetical protein IPG36_07655 [bacterium]